MINWLHNFNPQALLVSFGPFHIYWYGLFMVSGILIALGTSSILAKYYKIKADTLLDLAFWLIINGLIGARLYDVLLELSYYKSNPLDIFKIWQGGLAIHGAIIAGLITTYFFARKHKISLWTLSALIVPGLALAQAIGRWGNYFNQELFGLPTSLPWGIPISILNRPIAYLDYDYFQPTFLYESLGCFVIFIILISFSIYLIKTKKINDYYCIWVSSLYMILYSILRFSLEYIRADVTPIIFHMRWPQVISLIIILASLGLLIFNSHGKKEKENL